MIAWIFLEIIRREPLCEFLAFYRACKAQMSIFDYRHKTQIYFMNIPYCLALTLCKISLRDYMSLSHQKHQCLQKNIIMLHMCAQRNEESIRKLWMPQTNHCPTVKIDMH